MVLCEKPGDGGAGVRPCEGVGAYLEGCEALVVPVEVEVVLVEGKCRSSVS